METPSSTPALTASNNNVPTSKNIEDSEKIAVSKSRKRIGSQPLIDITNDSPIIGLAMGKVNTPSYASALAKTPSSGEALLRNQVRTLLQRVEEEAEFSKISSINIPFLHLKSPAGLLAQTPANTPHVFTLSGEEYFKTYCLTSVTASPVPKQLTISKIVSEFVDEYKQEGPESKKKNSITRSLFLDFSEKSDGSDKSLYSSVLTREEEIESKENSSRIEGDDDSVWSIQVNASAGGEEQEIEDSVIEDIGEENNEGYCDCEAEKVYYDDEGSVDALCEEMNEIRVYGGEKEIPIFAGRHTPFVYNSGDELVEGEEEEECGSSGILKLKGLPTPKGKHYSFPEEMGDEEN